MGETRRRWPGRRAFLDTTVSAERILPKRGSTSALEARLKQFSGLTTSRFVQLEFKRGPYKLLADFQADAEDAKVVKEEDTDTGFAELLERAVRFSGHADSHWQRRVGQGVLNIIVRFGKSGWQGRNSEWPLHLPPGGLDGLLLRNLRLHLRPLVRNAWRDAFDGLDEIIDPPGCLDDLPEPRWVEESNRVDSSFPEGYIRGKTQPLAGFVRRRSRSFRKILDALDNPEGDGETKRRVAAIGKILAKEAEPTDTDIRCLGDAFIAVECPTEDVLLNDNVRHFAPITEALGKRSEGLWNAQSG